MVHSKTPGGQQVRSSRASSRLSPLRIAADLQPSHSCAVLQPSEAFLKEQASSEPDSMRVVCRSVVARLTLPLSVPAQGKGSHSEDSAPQHPLNVPVASDSGDSNVGITEITNNSANKSGACFVSSRWCWACLAR